MSAPFARVALPLPLHSTYTYRVPDALAERAVPGARVVVPLRRREAIGVIVALEESSPVEARELLALPDAEPALSPALLALGKWMASYYGAPLGLALRTLLPADLWGTAEGGTADERLAVVAGEPLTLLERDERFKRRPRQRALYEALESLGGRAPVTHLREQLGFDTALVRALAGTGLIQVERGTRHRDPFGGLEGTPPPATLTPDQVHALARLDEVPPGGAALLFGVTGSGKTLVYLEWIRRALARGEGAIVLVPEISLTPQTVARLRGAFGDQVAVLHSGLSDGERADAWRALRRGDRRVAVGARSAIFAPVQRLGVIAIDEEHEATYKNGETPRYHARTVAAVRARLEGARLVLGSATPALETLARAGGRIAQIRLPVRVGERPMPPVELVDLRSAPLVTEALPVHWSVALDDAVRRTHARGEQTILLLNRRGFASFLQCPSCGQVRRCPNCSISLTVHQVPASLRCHYCDHQAPFDRACPECGHATQAMKGTGTQQLERLVAERFPEARLARMDLDTTSTKWGHQQILDRVGRGEVDILIGTQMIAKGLDFPDVTLVGVVDADTGLHLPDFPASERTFQLLAQVAGRAGRGARGGRVLVQTRSPDHHALRFAAKHDVEGFAAEEMAQRTSPAYPPTTGLVNLLVSGEDDNAVGLAAAHVAEWCEALATKHGLPVTVLGPARPLVARIKERWRWHVVLKGPPKELGRIVRYAARTLEPREGTRLVIDRDPVTLL